MPCVYLPGPAPAVTVANNHRSINKIHKLRAPFSKDIFYKKYVPIYLTMIFFMFSASL